ncbi:hypothetical protein AYK25_01530 [Thermoplasmatales archaeon SM1-50]|nr:MAG: hypothetical protein AYK25_01530 [Thermoplasmatales archaeon SM1-50]
MEGKFGNKKAGVVTRKTGLMMIISMLAVTLFIGVAVHPVLSANVVRNNLQPAADDEEYFYCDCDKEANDGAACKTCVEAVFHTVKYMKNHVKNTLEGKGIYFLWTADAAILILEGLILGVKDSGYKIEIDYNELKNAVTFWVSKLWGPQMFFITRFMARLFAISIGITWYLLTFCIDTSTILPT